VRWKSLSLIFFLHFFQTRAFSSGRLKLFTSSLTSSQRLSQESHPSESFCFLHCTTFWSISVVFISSVFKPSDFNSTVKLTSAIVATPKTLLHVIRRTDRLTSFFCTAHPFTQPPKYHALQCFSISESPQKCPFPWGHLQPYVIHVPWTHPTHHPKIASQLVQPILRSSRQMCVKTRLMCD